MQEYSDVQLTAYLTSLTQQLHALSEVGSPNYRSSHALRRFSSPTNTICFINRVPRMAGVQEDGVAAAGLGRWTLAEGGGVNDRVHEM